MKIINFHFLLFHGLVKKRGKGVPAFRPQRKTGPSKPRAGAFLPLLANCVEEYDRFMEESKNDCKIFHPAV